MGLLQALPAGVVDGVGVSRIALDAMGGCGHEGILAGEVELADAPPYFLLPSLRRNAEPSLQLR